MDPIYFTDDYPRIGCRVTIDVTAHSYNFSITAPEGLVIESYHAKTPRQLGRMLEEWALGFAPRGGDRLDQFSSKPASGSIVTE